MITIDKVSPVRSSDCTTREYVGAGHYDVAVQLGSGVQWRGLQGGKWHTDRVEEIPAPAAGHPPTRRLHMTMEPALHVLEHLDHHTVNGIIAHANKWTMASASLPARASLYDREGNVNHDFVAGQISRMVYLAAIEPSSPPPRADGSDASAVAAAVVAGIRELIASGILTPATTSKAKG